MASKKSESQAIQPTSVVPLGVWLRAGQVINPAPRWDFKASCNVYARGIVKQERAGSVVIKSGGIAVGDPIVLNAKVFSRKVPNGKYPVVLSKLVLGRDTTIAAATVVLRAGTIERFELARVNEKERYSQGYAVDSATAGFHDPKALPLLKPLTEDADAQIELSTRLAPGAELLLDKKSGLNIVGFQSGYGDGHFYSYWSLDAKGNVLSLTTDFDVITSFESLDVFRAYRGWELKLTRAAK